MHRFSGAYLTFPEKVNDWLLILMLYFSKFNRSEQVNCTDDIVAPNS